MDILLLYLLPLSIFLLYLFPKHRKNAKMDQPPGPRGLPFIGNLHQLDSSSPQRYLWQLSKKYGPLMTIKLGLIPTLVVSSAKLAKEVLKTQDLAFCSRPALVGQQKLSYNGLDMAFAPYNDYWREIRKICVLHLFSLKRVQSFRPVRENEVWRMITRISELSTSSKVANLSDILMALTSTIICRVAFGKRFEDEGCERSKFHGLLNEAQAMLGSFFVSDHFPIMGWVDKLTGLCGRLEKNFKDMDLFYQQLIDEHLNPNKPKSMEGDIIDILLQLKKEQSCPFHLTIDHIKAVLMNVFLGGTDTTSSTVVWAMTELMNNPKEMKRVQEEVRSTTCNGKKGLVDEDDVQKLPYLKAVIKETWRLNPPVPLLIQRETIQRSYLDGYEVPLKTIVYVNAYAVGRDPESWVDPEKFYPERFMGHEIDYRGNDFELIPFGAGRRGCPGMNLGALTSELILANLLYSFDWELPSGMKKEDIDYDTIPGVAVHKKNPLCLVPKSSV